MQDVPVTSVGVNHHLVALDELARLSAASEKILTRLDRAEVPGRILLNTCNRFELYAETETFHGGLELILGTIRDCLDPVDHRLVDQFEVYAADAAVQHLLEVTSGLDSMVVGEAEIIGQVRAALADAGPRATAALHRLFDAALTTAKSVATESGLGEAGRSLAQVGLDLVEQRHFPLAGRRVLLIGTGSYARVVTAALLRRGCTELAVHSPSGRAEQFAASHDVRPIGEDELSQALTTAELVVTCSGGRHRGEPILGTFQLAASRAGAPLLPILDLSLSGDVAADADNLANVDLIDLDEVGAAAPAAQSAAVLCARDLVNRGVETYLHLEQGRKATPAVTAIRAHVTQFIEREIESANRRYDAETAAAVAHSLRRVSNALLHTPSLRAAELARTGGLDDYSHALQTLFGIELHS